MSTKYVAAAAVAAVAISSADASLFRIKDQIGPLVNRPAHPILFEEDEWQVNAGIQGGQGRPQWQVGVSHQWEEEQNLKTAAKKAVKVVIKAHELGLLEEDAEQSKTLGKAIKIVNVAKDMGLLEEEEEQGIGAIFTKLNDLALKSPGKFGLLEEEEEEQKFKIGKTLKKVAKVAAKAHDMGLLEEDEAQIYIPEGEYNPWAEACRAGRPCPRALIFEDEEQKFKIGKTLKKVAKVAAKAHDMGLLEEDEAQIYIPEGEYNPWAQGCRAGRPCPRVLALLEEDEEEQALKLKLNAAAKVLIKANEMGLLEEEEQVNLSKSLKKAATVLIKAKEIGLLEEQDAEQKFKLGKALKKAGRVLAKAHDIGLLEEEEWQVNAGISGGQGRPQWQVGVSHSWDEEEQKFKIGKTLKKVAKIAAKAHDMGLLEEDEEQIVARTNCSRRGFCPNSY